MVRHVLPTDLDRLTFLVQQFYIEADYPASASRRNARTQVDWFTREKDAIALVWALPIKDSLFGTDQPEGFFGGIVEQHPILDVPTLFELGWFMLPEHRRGTGAIRLLKEAEKEARALGASMMQMTAIDEKVGGFLTRRGYTARERTYLRTFGDNGDGSR